jgi:iron complex outermembrane recepter protein
VVDLPRLPLITADYYQITINDRIELGDVVSDSVLVRMFEESGMAGIRGGTYFTNGLDTRTRGLDLVASHALLIRTIGVLRIVAGYNNSRTSVIRLADPPPELARFGPTRFNRATRGFLERSQPRETITLTTNYSAGPVALNLHNQRSGPTAALDQTSPEADRILAARWITDLRLAYRLGQRVQLAASVLNLFDEYPPEYADFKDGLNAQGPSMQGIFRHPGALSPFGMNGRTAYLQLTYR